MKHKLIASLLCLVPSVLAAQTFDLAKSGGRPRNLFSLSGQVLLNSSSRLHTAGGKNGGPATGGAEHFYDDGYHRVDSSGNAGGRSGFFGFQNDSQVNLGAQTLSLHAVQSAIPDPVPGKTTGPTPGVEFRYTRLVAVADRQSLGFQLGFGYLRLNQRINYGPAGPSPYSLITDVYGLGSVVPQPAPYSGQFSVTPGSQRIFDVPARTPSTVAGTAQGNYKFDTDAFLMRLGPWWQWDATSRLSLSLHGGLAIVVTTGDFTYNDTIALANGLTFNQTGGAADSDYSVGGYAGADVRFEITPRLSAFGNAYYLTAGRTLLKGGERTLRLDFSNSVLLGAGLSWNF